MSEKHIKDELIFIDQKCSDLLEKVSDTFNENYDSDYEPLMEMANAPQKYTGMSGVVYFSTKEEIENKQGHSLGRVKLRKDGEEVSCSIKTKKDGTRILKGNNERLLKLLVQFVKLNEDLLWDYWNTPAGIADSSETMKKFKKIK